MEQKTPLYERHVQCGGKMVPFAGFMMPVQYSDVIAEHTAVRTAAGLFDVSHMGEVLLSGPGATDNLNRMFTNRFDDMAFGRVRYTPICNEDGGTVDDILVYRRGTDDYFIIVNASNRHKDVAFMRQHLSGGAQLRDISDDKALVALQGPRSREILAGLAAPAQLPAKYYSFAEDVSVAGVSCLVSQTGYTGEFGYELCCNAADAGALWDALMEAGKPLGLLPCGLGARDTLRLEAGMPLYGHEMNDSVSPLETGLGFAVKMDKDDFVGKSALAARGAPAIARVGLRMTGRGIAREDCPVFAAGGQVGKTTSGTHCPTLGGAYAMALLGTAFSAIGTAVQVEVRGRRIDAEVVPLPFYKRS